jgi:hypothetical protein
LEAGYHQQRGAVLALGCEHYAASTDTYPGRGVARRETKKEPKKQAVSKYKKKNGTKVAAYTRKKK